MSSDETYDFIVVGAGAAGSVVASRLSEDEGARVLVVEAGPDDTDPRIATPAAWPSLMGSELDWGYRTAPQPELGGRRLTWPRGRVVGGSGAINAMVHVRGAASDFDAWSQFGGDEWSAQAFMPYLEAAEGPADADDYGRLPIATNTTPHPFATAFVDASRTFGLVENPDFNGLSQEGVGLYRTTRTMGAPGLASRRGNTAYTHLRHARRRPNVTVLTRATVLQILTEGGRATGIRLRSEGLEVTVRCSSEVILSAGAVGSPQLLLLSGIGPARDLEPLGIRTVVNLPGVGENLHDHVQVSLAYDTTERRDVLPSSNLGEAGGFATLYPGSPAPDVQLSFAPMKNLNDGSDFGRGFTVGPGVTRPLSRGRLTLDSARATDHPRIDPAYLSDPADLETLVDGVLLARDIAACSPLADIAKDGPLAASADRSDVVRFVRENAQTQFHPVGTCRFGIAEDDLAVVDTRLRVRGIDGLRVVDAAVIPSMITGNIHAAVVGVAERAGAMIKEDHR